MINAVDHSVRIEDMVKPTILIITDSLAFPRSEPQLVCYEQTWVALLKRACPQADIIHHGRGGATLRELCAHSQYFFRTVSPDLVIMQSGIVDCAPRAMSQIERMVVSRLPRFFGRIIQNNATSLRRIRKIQYGPAEQFDHYVETIETAFRKVLWLGVAPVHRDWESSVPGITQAIQCHNEILQKRSFLSLSDLSEVDIMEDHHHLTVKGHAKVAKRLLAHPALSEHIC